MSHSPSTPSGRPRVGFIGLGVMGRPMASNILKAGFALTVNSRSADQVEGLVSGGASRARTPADAAAASDILFIMVPDTADLVEVLDGPHGVMAGGHQGLIVCDTGTHAPSEMSAIARRLDAVGADFIDCPVSGGEIGAQQGTLAIMVGGPADAFQRARPVLDSIGTVIVHIGPVGAGQIAKACNQLLVASTIQAVAEALVLATASGVDPARVREVMLGGFASSKVLEVHGKRMLEGDFNPGARTSLHAKDARIVLDTATQSGVPLPGFAPVAASLQRLVDLGDGDLDHSALVTLLGGATQMPWTTPRSEGGGAG
ncbi:MAG: NAD(P)-dependent oxidoreductase [Actinomycetota bacterium]